MACTLLRVSLRVSRHTSHHVTRPLLLHFSSVAAPNPPPSSLLEEESSTTFPRKQQQQQQRYNTNLLLGQEQSQHVNGIGSGGIVNGHAATAIDTKSDLVVVLDMDECLIHSQFFSPHAAKLTHQFKVIPKSSSHVQHDHQDQQQRQRQVDTFRLTLPDGDVVQVHVRPYLHDFLSQVCSRYETFIFTAAMKVYARPVLDVLLKQTTSTTTTSSSRGSTCCEDEDNNNNNKKKTIQFAGIHYREDCVYVDGQYIKDLSIFQKPLERLVLVDNNPSSFLTHPNNGILVNSFYHDPNDTTLRRVLELLHELDCHQGDVRPILERKFGLSNALEELRKSE